MEPEVVVRPMGWMDSAVPDKWRGIEPLSMLLSPFPSGSGRSSGQQGQQQPQRANDGKKDNENPCDLLERLYIFATLAHWSGVGELAKKKLSASCFGADTHESSSPPTGSLATRYASGTRRQVVASVRAHTARVLQSSFSPDGEKVCSLDGYGRLCVCAS